MKRIKKAEKLVLKTETVRELQVRQLEDAQLAQIAGGAPTTSRCGSCTCSW